MRSSASGCRLMCTLIAIHRSVPGYPLVVAANRDEYLSRPAAGPALRRTPGGWVVAPLDLHAGGSWLGLNRRGVFSALTNLKNDEPDPKRESRGLVVMEALAAASAERAATRLGALPEGRYNPFNCLVADAERAYLLVYRDVPQLRELPPGVHVIGNGDAGDTALPKVGRVLRRARAAANLPRERLLEALADICREHDCADHPLDDTCVHLADTYGTRSSILLELTGSLEESRLLYADGPPCVEQYEDCSSLLDELRQAPSYGAVGIRERKAS